MLALFSLFPARQVLARSYRIVLKEKGRLKKRGMSKNRRERREES